jgi:hypothetical protein
MIRPLNLHIAVILLVAMAGNLAVQQAQGQAMSATVRTAGAPADTDTTKAPNKKEAKSASTGASTWTASAKSFASPGKGTWGGSQGFSPTNKSAWIPSSEAFSQGAVQPGGVWRTRPGFSAPPEGAASTNRTEAESVSVEPAPSGLRPSAIDASHVSASRISKPAASRESISGGGTDQSAFGSHQSDLGARQFGISARQSAISGHRFGAPFQSAMSGHQFGVPLQGKAGGKLAFGISGQRHAFTATRFGGMRSMRGNQSGSASAGQNGTTGLGDRSGVQSPGLGQPRLSGLGVTGSGFDLNPWEPQRHSGQSKPR